MLVQKGLALALSLSRAADDTRETQRETDDTSTSTKARSAVQAASY
jgi:hypothetical protein